MNKLFATMTVFATLWTPLPSLSQPQVTPYTHEAMGCMKLRECTDEVYELTSMDVIREHFPSQSYTMVYDEAEMILANLRESGVKVYLAAGFNFPRTHRGSYYTDTNTFFLNANHMWDQYVFIKVLRHEAWHAAQDCMAGGIDNSFIAVIHDEEKVPEQYQLSARVRYRGDWARAIPWEQEAIWAGNTADMSSEALAVCASGTPMWDVYDPTPKTREWLENKGLL